MQDNMNIKKTNENTWVDKVKKYKNEIAIATVTTCAVIAGVVIYKNGSTAAKKIKEVNNKIPMLMDTVENNKNNRTPIHVSVPEHVRRLPEGQKHSKRKVELAAKLGYELPENKTIVNAYSYERRCA